MMETESDAVKKVKDDAVAAHEDVVVKRRSCRSRRAKRVAAALIGIFLSAGITLGLYVAGVFDSGPELPEVMEGEATFLSHDGESEAFHVMIDYKKNIVQLSSLDSSMFSGKASFGRRLMTVAENGTVNGTKLNATKIIIQDYNTMRKYFVVPAKNGSHTTKCIYTALEGEMIPRHLLKHATLQTENVEDNLTHSLFRVGNETEIDVYRAKGRNGKIYEVYLHLPNATMHMRSKENGLNFTEFQKLNCYQYDEENDTIEEAFYNSNDSKTYQEMKYFESAKTNKTLQDLSANLSLTLNDTTEFSADMLATELPTNVSRRRRGIGIRRGSLDWWYGNWCGPKQGGHRKDGSSNPNCYRYCSKPTSYISSACRACLPPKDGLDEACMEHDRCIVHDRTSQGDGFGPKWCQPVGNRCKCDSPFVRRAFSMIFRCPTHSCRSHALQVFFTFSLFLSCWFPTRICFPWVHFTCHCKNCLCPSIQVYWKCISFKMCAFFGTGEVFL